MCALLRTTTGSRLTALGSAQRSRLIIREQEQIIQLGQHQQKLNLRPDVLEHDLLSALDGMPVHHDQRTQPRGVDFPGRAKIDDQLSAPLAHLVQQGVGLLPKRFAGLESKCLRRLQHPAMGLHGGNSQGASSPG